MPEPRPGPDVPYRKRCKRVNAPGHAHYLTFSCFKRRPFLSRDRSRQWAIDAIHLARSSHSFDLWAYVVMPEHAHVIVFPRQAAYDISAFLNTFKQSVSKRALHFVNESAPEFLEQMADRQPNGQVSYRFWQRGGGYDRNLWSPKDIWEKIDYVHNNPVERKLCDRAEDWVWSSAADYLGIRNGPLTLDLESLGPRR